VITETHDSPRTQLITLAFHYVLKYNQPKKKPWHTMSRSSDFPHNVFDASKLNTYNKNAKLTKQITPFNRHP